jgi:hypothetical protein
MAYEDSSLGKRMADGFDSHFDDEIPDCVARACTTSHLIADWSKSSEYKHKV